MKNGNVINSLSSKISETNGFSGYNIPILKFPKSEDEFVCYILNKDKKYIEIYLINIDSSIKEKYPIESCPVEICENCQDKLTLDNLSFAGNYRTLKLFCRKCCPKDGTIVDLYSTANNNTENKKLIEKLKLYLKKNKDTSSPEYENIMSNLIFYTDAICRLMNLEKLKEQKWKDSFKNYISFLKSYINSLSSYLEIVIKLNMDNLYLFLKNLFIISTINNDKYFLKALLSFYSKKKEYMNVSLIHSGVLEKIIENKDNIPTIDEKAELMSKMAKIELKQNIGELKTDLAHIKVDFIFMKNAELKKKIEIMELKANIVDFLRSYNYSYYYISSKKVLERKFINGILFILFKYNHKRFQKVKEDEFILNSILKELKNIIKFLGYSNNKTKEKLKSKIKDEIKLLENKKEKINPKNNTMNNQKSEPEEQPSKEEELSEEEEDEDENKIVLTDKEKALLTDYFISDSDEYSYSTIYASKLNNKDRINNEKLQAILEFLFFIRDKTIAIIHLLNETSSLFFEFLNENSLQKNITKKEIIEETKDEISDNVDDDDEDDDDDDDDYSFNMEELKKEFKYNFSKKYKKENGKLLKNLSVKPTSQVDCVSAIDYIFSNNPYNNYKNEINYLFENFVLPNQYKDKIFTHDNQKEKKSYYISFQDNCYIAFNLLSAQFKDDPLYKSFIDYYSDLGKKKEKNKVDIEPQIIKFYENNVENFHHFRDLIIMKAEAENYIKEIESDNETLKKMKYIKEKYKFIKKELKKHFNPNQEIYLDYYEEWKKKNWKFVVKDYELKDLIDDIKYLIPKDEKMTVVGKDKKNFSLILYLFQNDYFLKDFI